MKKPINTPHVVTHVAEMFGATRIKICGFTRQADAENAIDMGVDALGLVFYEKSKRAVCADDVAWIRQLAPFTQLVALFVNPKADFVHQVTQALPIDVLQFHGNESPAFCEQFSRRYIKAVPMQGKNRQQAIEYMQGYQQASAFLLDNYGVNEIGGSGTAFDWQHIPDASETAKPLIMAGGLHTDNVGQVIERCAPYGVDVSSGVETAAGIKSAEKMQAFVQAVRERQ